MAFQPVSIRISQSESDPDWDRFVASVPGASFVQTGSWARVKSIDGWKPLRVVLSRENEIVGGAQILLKPISLVGYLGYLAQGPLARGESGLQETTIRAMASAAKQFRIRYLLAQPPDFTWHETLTRCGFLPEAPASSAIIDTTLILDLTPEPEALLSAMRKTSAMKSAPGFGAAFRCGRAGSRIWTPSSP